VLNGEKKLPPLPKKNFGPFRGETNKGGVWGGGKSFWGGRKLGGWDSPRLGGTGGPKKRGGPNLLGVFFFWPRPLGDRGPQPGPGSQRFFFGGGETTVWLFFPKLFFCHSRGAKKPKGGQGAPLFGQGLGPRLGGLGEKRARGLTFFFFLLFQKFFLKTKKNPGFFRFLLGPLRGFSLAKTFWGFF